MTTRARTMRRPRGAARRLRRPSAAPALASAAPTVVPEPIFERASGPLVAAFAGPGSSTHDDTIASGGRRWR